MESPDPKRLDCMSDSVLFSMWCQMLSDEKEADESSDQNILRDELVSRGVLRFDPGSGRYVVERMPCFFFE